MTKNFNSVLLFITIGILVSIGCLSIFSGKESRVLKRQLEETTTSLSQARDTLLSLKTSLENLQKELDVAKLKSDMLSAQRDSLILAFRRKNAVDRIEVIRIEKEQTKVKEKLKLLRQTENKLKW
jgi:hypothetical protein